MHTVGNSENTLPCANPSKALAFHRLATSLILAAVICEIRKKEATRVMQYDLGKWSRFLAKSEARPG